MDKFHSSVSLKGKPMGTSTLASLPIRHQTATGAVINYNNSVSNLDAVIRRELLPGALGDVAGVDQFDSWIWHGFHNHLNGDATGLVSALHRQTRMHHEQSFTLAVSFIQECLMAHDLNKLMRAIEANLMYAVKLIVGQKPHDLATCTDPECYC